MELAAALFAAARPHHLKADQTLFTAGDPGDGCYRVSGKISVDEVNELLDVELPDEEWDSVGGLLLDIFGRIPPEGEEIRFQGLVFKVEKVQGRRIAKVLITRDTEASPNPEGALAGH